MSNLTKTKSAVTADKPEDIAPQPHDIYIERRSEEAIRIISRDTKQGSVKNHYWFYERLADVLTLEWKQVYHNITQEDGSISTEPNSISSSSLDEYYTKVSVIEFNKWAEMAKAFIETGELKGFDTDNSSVNEETALMGTRDKQMLINVQQGLEQKAAQLEGMERIINVHMERQRRNMEVLKQELNNKLAVFQKQIEQIMRVITIIELYLGIEEELHQIQDGATASIDTPITFRQQVLYMDEETAILTDGGLDYNRIEEFDEWVLKNGNYKKLLPEEKGVIALHPRRHKKDYGRDDYYSEQWNQANKLHTYFLIRNGEQIYRIYTDKIIVPDRLFPKKKELQELFDSIQTGLAKQGYSEKEEAKKAEDKMYYYRKLAFFYQGLIDRTDVFKPTHTPLSVFKVDEYPERFNFIYDAEAALPSGRLPFWEWHAEINSKIKRGSRVIINDPSRDYNGGRKHSDDLRSRFYNKVAYTHNFPQGIYEVDEIFNEETDSLPHYYIDELREQGLLISQEEQPSAHMCPGYEKYETHHQPRKGVAIQYFKAKKPHEKQAVDTEYFYADRLEPENISFSNSGTYIRAHKCTYKRRYLVVRYNPGGTVYSWSGDYGDRKNKTPWTIEPRDEFLFNYDLIDTEMIKFYLESRVDRENYYLMIPLLQQVLKMRKEEHTWEREFVKMVAGAAMRKYGEKLDRSKCYDFTWQCIEWWKNRVIIKRPITKDDTLALRMI